MSGLPLHTPTLLEIKAEWSPILHKSRVLTLKFPHKSELKAPGDEEGVTKATGKFRGKFIKDGIRAIETSLSLTTGESCALWYILKDKINDLIANAMDANGTELKITFNSDSPIFSLSHLESIEVIDNGDGFKKADGQVNKFTDSELHSYQTVLTHQEQQSASGPHSVMKKKDPSDVGGCGKALKQIYRMLSLDKGTSKENLLLLGNRRDGCTGARLVLINTPTPISDSFLTAIAFGELTVDASKEDDAFLALSSPPTFSLSNFSLPFLSSPLGGFSSPSPASCPSSVEYLSSPESCPDSSPSPCQ